jgi:hypothetical protein
VPCRSASILSAQPPVGSSSCVPSNSYCCGKKWHSAAGGCRAAAIDPPRAYAGGSYVNALRLRVRVCLQVE